MRASGALDERLRIHVVPTILVHGGQEAPFYVMVEPPLKAIVEERNIEGEARVECTLPDRSRCIQWTLGTGKFQFLRGEKNADGALLVFRDDGSPDGAFEAHVFKCKKTVDRTKWRDALQQMRSTLARLLAISGTLGIPIVSAVFYTAFRRNNLSSDNSLNPARPRIPIGGGPQDDGQRELNRARQLEHDWVRNDITLDGFDGRFPHRKVKLDDATGAGTVDLSEAHHE
jgi:hypothetical protein